MSATRARMSGSAILFGVGRVRSDEDVVHRPQWMAVGERFGVGDVQGCPSDLAGPQSRDQVIGHHVFARGRH